MEAVVAPIYIKLKAEVDGAILTMFRVYETSSSGWVMVKVGGGWGYLDRFTPGHKARSELDDLSLAKTLAYEGKELQWSIS